MVEQDLQAADQPTKADMGEGVSIDAAPEALAWAITLGGIERQADDT